MSDTPRTDAAAIGFARILVDRETFNVTEIIPADFARTLERTLLQVQGERDRIRQETLEEAAKVVESLLSYRYGAGGGLYPNLPSDFAAAIRALGEKPVSTLTEK